MTNLAVNTNTVLFDIRTGKMTREGMNLIDAITKLVNQATSELVTVETEQTLDNKTVTGYTKTVDLAGLLIEDSIVDGDTSKAPSSNAVFDALALKQPGSAWSNRTLLTGTAAYDPPSLVDGAGATTTVTVTGAVLGNMALASFSLTLSGITVTAYVSAADTVSVRFQNESGGTLDLSSGILTAWAFA